MSVESARPFRAGQKQISAGTLNAMLRAIRELQTEGPGAELKTVCCQNDTGSDLAEYQIVGIGGLNQTHAAAPTNFLKSIVVTGSLPTDTYAGKFAVTQEPIKKGQTGRVKISGVSQCKVNVTDSGHAYAKGSTAGGITQLTSAAAATDGGAEILWKESGTGSKWAVIRWPVYAGSGSTINPATDTPQNLKSAGAVGTEAEYAQEDHSHGTNLAVGDVKMAMRIDDHAVNGHTWKLLNGRTIGDASSGATWASADAEALFLLLWANAADTYCPVSGGRGASAAADWAAHKTLTIPSSTTDGGTPDAYQRYPAGAGSVLAVAQTGGAATHGGTDHGANTGSNTTGITVDAHSEQDADLSGSAVPVVLGGSHSVNDGGHTHGLNLTAVNTLPKYFAVGFFILAKIA